MYSRILLKKLNLEKEVYQCIDNGFYSDTWKDGKKKRKGKDGRERQWFVMSRF